MSRIARPKNAAPNTIFTSFEPGEHGVHKIRYSGEPIPVLVPGKRFQVPVAWGLFGPESTPPDGDVPVGSCCMSRRLKRLPQHVREAENGDTRNSTKARTHAFTVWFEYLLDEAAKP